MGLQIVRDVTATRPPIWTIDSDPTVFVFDIDENAELLQILFRTDTPSIYFKTTNSPNGWTLAGVGGSPVASQRYVAIGGESDFNVILANPQPNDTYRVLAQCSGVSAIVDIDCPDTVAGDRTTTQFRVVTSSALVAGDKIDFAIIPQ